MDILFQGLLPFHGSFSANKFPCSHQYCVTILMGSWSYFPKPRRKFVETITFNIRTVSVGIFLHSQRLEGMDILFQTVFLNHIGNAKKMLAKRIYTNHNPVSVLNAVLINTKAIMSAQLNLNFKNEFIIFCFFGIFISFLASRSTVAI